jgi:cytidylate kinase
VRTEINRTLRTTVAGGRWVVEGRDMGTEVFPDAIVKVYLDAAPAVRATRRARQRGSATQSVGRIAADLAERDRRDRRKSMGALRPAADAQFIETSHLTAAEVCAKVVSVIPTNFPPE